LSGINAAGLDRLAQPFHGEFDILRLQISPALDLGPVQVLGKRWKYSAASFLPTEAALLQFRRL
jgi:hypothetical protein